MYASLLQAIGNTPLVKVNFASPGSIYAKLEYLNPGGSVKDRSALFMIEEAERNGTLKPGGTIIDASSGNQGIAAAMIGAIKGYKVIITVSDKISEEKLHAIKAYGADTGRDPFKQKKDAGTQTITMKSKTMHGMHAHRYSCVPCSPSPQDPCLTAMGVDDNASVLVF